MSTSRMAKWNWKQFKVYFFCNFFFLPNVSCILPEIKSLQDDVAIAVGGVQYESRVARSRRCWHRRWIGRRPRPEHRRAVARVVTAVDGHHRRDVRVRIFRSQKFNQIRQIVARNYSRKTKIEIEIEVLIFLLSKLIKCLLSEYSLL